MRHSRFLASLEKSLDLGTLSLGPGTVMVAQGQRATARDFPASSRCSHLVTSPAWPLQAPELHREGLRGSDRGKDLLSCATVKTAQTHHWSPSLRCLASHRPSPPHLEVGSPLPKQFKEGRLTRCM